jgi:hypothetical protein
MKPNKITFWPNGGISARDKDGNEIDALQGKGWMQLYFEWLEQQGVDPTAVVEFEALINGAWVSITPFRTDYGWNMRFDKA